MRKEVSALRKAQSSADRAKKSRAAFERWRAEWPARVAFRGLKISLYRSLPDEIDLAPLHEYLDAEGAELFFPRFSSREDEVFHLAKVGKGTKWGKGPFGIEEPVGGEVLADPSELDLIFVPGLIFGPRGERIGFGKGHYDRFLAHCPRALRVSLAFDFQCRENIPQQPWDQPVDWVLTELRDFRTEAWSRKIGLL